MTQCTRVVVVGGGHNGLAAAAYLVVFEKATKVLYDAREIEILDNDSERYISGIFTKEMVGAGVKYAAAVLPEDVFAKYSIDNIQQKIIDNKNACVNYFNSMANAIKWLENK